jgi:quinol monooxygenase YgiN
MKRSDQIDPIPDGAGPVAADAPRLRAGPEGDCARSEYDWWLRLLRAAAPRRSKQGICKATVAAMALGSMAVVPTALAQSAENTGQNSYVVMVEFAVKAEESEAVEATVRGLLDTIVHKQEGFQFARIHREIGGGKVINYMQWSSKEAFDTFRAAHKDQLSAAVGKFGPKFVFYQIAYTIEPKR